MKTNFRPYTAFAPATVANVAVGFDILGFSFPALGDEVTVTPVDSKELGNPVTIELADGLVSDLPLKAEENTAGAGLLQFRKDLGLNFGFHVKIRKGIPKSSGLGGSAASAVASILAANASLEKALPIQELLPYALAGEAVASPSVHADNVTPCLLGGLQLIRSLNPLATLELPVPDGLYCVLVHPEAVLETKRARQVLKKDIPLPLYVQQSSRLASFIAACYRNDLELMGDCLEDLVIEPQRAQLVSGFLEVKQAAMAAGALGCSLSGSGPSIFALVQGEKIGRTVQKAMSNCFHQLHIKNSSWLRPLSKEGAKLLS
ncbi:MAG: homoserine kinase [Oligoflexales bacterium]|nr:homoserine kinase [Oligoflexales bacterium]